jgi:uncharacterized membrane protein YGL010W
VGAVQVGCWLAQFLGHGLLEGRSPALLDNLLQAFFMAPVFVLLEVGTRPPRKRQGQVTDSSSAFIPPL